MGPVSLSQIAKNEKEKKMHTCTYIHTYVHIHIEQCLGAECLATPVPSMEKKKVAGGWGWKGNFSPCTLPHLLIFELWGSIIF